MKKTIAFFAESLYGGGVERILQTILLNFDYEKYDVTLYSARPDMLREGFYPIQLRHYHYFDKGEDGLINKVKSIVKNKIKLWVYYHCSPRLFYKMFIRKEYDIAVAFIEGYATRIVSGASNITKKIAWLHTDMENNHWTDVAYRSRKEEYDCYCKFRNIVCVSQVVLEKAKENLFLDGKVRVLYNPIDVKNIISKSKETVCIPKIAYPRIITLGSLTKVKGYDRLLAIVKRLKDEGHLFELDILGKGVEEKALMDMARACQLDNTVKFLGFKDNPYPYLASADIYVCSSYAEGFNTSITEALILGIPVVTTDVSGTREQLGNNSDYGIITENDEESLYEGLKSMMDDGIREGYRVKSKNRGLLFSLEKCMNQIYEMIET